MARLTPTQLRGSVQTVRGLLAPSELGATLMHEHVLCDIRTPEQKCCDHDPEITLSNQWAIMYGELDAPSNALLDQVDCAAEELALGRRDGARAVVDLSCGGLRPDPAGLVAVSKRADVHIVMGCGHYVEQYQAPENAQRSVDSFADEMLDQLYEGAWGTQIRAGIIGEIGCQAPWTGLERRVMEGAVLAMKDSGAALSVHPGRDADQPQEIAEFLLERGADTARVILSHIDRTIFDPETLFRLADTGCVIEFDLFGMENAYYKLNKLVDMPNDGERLRWIRALIDRGHLDQITISHDICYRTRLVRYGGHGYGHIFRNIVPLMRRRGFDEQEVARILVGTPARLLTFA